MKRYVRGDTERRNNSSSKLITDPSVPLTNSDVKRVKSVTITSELSEFNTSRLDLLANLQEIDVDDKNSNYCSIDGVLFSSDKSTLIKFPRGRSGEYRVPVFTTVIGDGAFEGSKKLTSIKLPPNLKLIENKAFRDCHSLQSIIIPKSTEEIEYYAFTRCKSLQTVDFSGASAHLGEFCFSYCKSLKQVYGDDNLTFDETAFKYSSFSVDGEGWSKNWPKPLNKEDYPWGKQIEDVYVDVLDKLGLWSEPSVQGNYGRETIMKKSTDDVVYEGDYYEIGDDLEDIYYESKSKSDFKKSVIEYIKNMISSYKEEDTPTL
jgi:hypothetical protein